MGSLTDHWLNSAGNKKASMCICFNSEELLGIKATFSLIIFKLSSIRFLPVQDLTGWCWLQSHSAFFYDFGSCESTLKNKTKLMDSSFSTWLEEALERSKYLACLHHQSMLQMLWNVPLSCKTKPCIFGKSALFWWHQALLCTSGKIFMSPWWRQV